MEELNFTVEHHPGQRHGNADDLSRRPCTKTDCACCTSNTEPDLHNLQNGVSAFGGPANRSDRPHLTAASVAVVVDPSVVDGTRENRANIGSGKLTTVVADVHPVPRFLPDISCCDASDCRVAATTTATESDERAHVQGDVEAVVTQQTQEPETVSSTGELVLGTTLSWSVDDLRAEQRKDEVIGTVTDLLERFSVKPQWDDVALKHRDVKVLWAMWPRLAIRDCLLKRRFEEAVNGADRWQIVMPRIYRQDFMSVAHGGMTGGHLGRQKTAAAIQSRAYWPTWFIDLDTFMRQCSTCARYFRGTLPHHILCRHHW
jgi:hypothetical protein